MNINKSEKGYAYLSDVISILMLLMLLILAIVVIGKSANTSRYVHNYSTILIHDYANNDVWSVDTETDNFIRVPSKNIKVGALKKSPQLVRFANEPDPKMDSIYIPKYVKLKDNLTKQQIWDIINYFGYETVFNNRVLWYASETKFRIDFFKGNIPSFIEVIDIPIPTNKVEKE